MTVSQLIGLNISKIRFSYQRENEYGMQEFWSYIKLSNGKIISIPQFPDDSIDLVARYENVKSTSFLIASRCGMASRVLFKNQKIVDVHFKYLEGEFYEDSRGIIELENGMYVTENNFGPQGLTDIDLQIYTHGQFLKLEEDEIKLRSFKNDIAVKG